MNQLLFSDSDSDSDLENLVLLSDWSDDEEEEDEDEQLHQSEEQRPTEHLESKPLEDEERKPPEGDPITQFPENLNTHRRKLRRVNYMQSLEDADFTFRFRLSKTAVNTLLNEITPLLRVTSKRNHGVSPLHQMLLALRYYALGTMIVSIADILGVSRSTACRVVRDVSTAIARLYDKYIFMHSSSAEKFYEIAGFPNVLGVIDCTYVSINAGPSPGDHIKNFKGNKLLNVQAVCDADYKFMNFVARWPGSTCDETIFNDSELKDDCEAGQFGDRWLLGDNAYTNRSNLLTPLLNPVTEPEHSYNQAHLETWNTIARTFQLWKNRFPVVALTLRLALANAQTVVLATAVLHNISRNYDLVEIPTEVDLPPEYSNSLQGMRYMTQEDAASRTELINTYFNKEIVP